MRPGVARTVSGPVLTADGARMLRAELEQLANVELPSIAELVRSLRQDGELSDNPALLDVMEQQSQVEQRIASLRAHLSEATIVEHADPERADVGTVVTVLDLESESELTLQLVGSYEADATLDRISIESPIGAALCGLRAGEVAHAQTPSGTRSLRVLSVEPAPSMSAEPRPAA